ncbi:MAG: glycosyltransferase [Lachnospiraceae bacterium]|nr:glycosyltransferase [Lachnospiraceae bacterium]
MDRETAALMFKEHSFIEKYRKVGYTVYADRIDKADVSIMIPTYKRPELLIKAVSSVLEQKTKYSIEIVIVDNDLETTQNNISQILSKINDSRVCYIQNDENIGMFGNWNRCIELSNSDWLIILNDDDELEENYIEEMMNTATSIPGCKALCCRHYLIDDNGDSIPVKEINARQDKTIPIKMKDLYLMQPIDIMGCLFNRAAALKIGGFNGDLFPCSDAVFLMRMCAEKGLYLNTRKLFRYRWAVNESQRPETRINFAKFQVQKSFEINKKYKLYGNTLNRFITNSKCDYGFYPLMLEGIIIEGNNETLRDELGVDRKFSPFRRFLYRVINRLYTYVIYGRKDAV